MDRLSTRCIASTTALAALIAALAPVLVVTSCRSATEINLNIRTNVACTSPEQWHGVAVYLGEPGTLLEGKSPTLVTTDCDSTGQVGSLVVAPSGGKGDVIGLRVVAGLTRNPEDCAAAAYAGCIVARRTVRFTPHETLALDVALTADCIGQACDSGHTCLTGNCVGSQFIEPLAPPAPTPVVPEAGATDGGANVRCGDNGVRCPTSGNVCCLSVDADAGTTNGRCGPGTDCPPTSIVLMCDDDSDCSALDDPDAGPGLCALSYEPDPGNEFFTPRQVSLSACLPPRSQLPGVGHAGLALCQDRTGLCGGRFPCIRSHGSSSEQIKNALPGYFWCEVSRP